MSDQQFAIDGAGTETAGIDNWRRVNRLDLDLLDRPQQYEIFDPGLVEAVNTALGLGMPLLVTGEPGVGKSTLARFVAHKLCLLYTSPSPRDATLSRMPSSA